ncbi:MAG: nuclear transport factor 2 family protein [Nevskia sp.]|nr:nuclear transport factor 2 family protein [Nevskia sp.]
MSIEDRTAIIDNIYAYSYAWDGQDIESFLKVFTDDGVWEVYASGATEPELRLPNPAAIRAWGTERLGRRKGKFVSRHFQTNTVFDHLDANSARTRTMVLVSHQGIDDAAPKPMLMGVYYDEHRRTAQGWRIRHRVVRHDQFSPHVTKT